MKTLVNLMKKTIAKLVESDESGRAAGDRVVREITFVR